MSTLENNTAKLQEILNTVNDLPSGGGGGGSSAAIVDVAELPTENINESVFYRVPTAEFYYNQTPQTTIYCYVVETLPETGEPATDATMSEIRVYCALDTGAVSGYLTAGLAQAFGVSAGWYPAATLFQLAGMAYGGIVSSLQDMTAFDTYYVLLQDQVKYFNEGAWHNVQGIGWRGSGIAAEIFNTLKNEANGVCAHAEGFGTVANGEESHAEGYFTCANGFASHAEGSKTIASGECQHVEGYCNIEDTENKYAHIVGNGQSDGRRSNAYTLDWDGNAWFAGTMEGTGVILTSPNGTRYMITVSNSGTLSASAVS